MGLIDDTRLKWHLIIKNLIERTPEYGNKGIMKTYYESLFKEYDKRLLQQPNFIDENEKMFYDGVRLGMEKSITNYANDYLEAQRDKLNIHIYVLMLILFVKVF